MKNLKKVLALGLALVMVLGMFTMVSAADEAETATKIVPTDLADWEEVENKDAVALNVDLGIIKGRSDGNFGAADPIRRDEWAKMVYVAMVGDDAAAMYEGDAAYTDMVTNWAKGYVNYLSSINVVSGFAGLYSPEAPITVVQAAKTMLTALGYDAEKEGYVNDDAWTTKVMAKAKKLGIMAGIDQKQDDKITKDNAAQMVFNCLFCNTVVPESDRDMGEWYVSGYTEGETLGYEVFGLIRITGTVASLNATGKAVLTNVYVNGEDAEEMNIDVSAVSGVYAVEAEQVGQNAVVYATGKITRNKEGEVTKIELTGAISSGLVTAGSKILKDTFDGVADWTKVFTKAAGNTAYVAGKDNDVAVYLNSTTPGAKLEAVAAGNRVQMIDNDANGKIDTVKITTYTVATVGAKGVEVTTNKTDKKDYITVAGVDGLAASDKVLAANVSGYEDLKAKDVILVSKINNKITLEKAEIVSGKATRITNDNKITVNGTVYVSSELVNKIDFAEVVDMKNKVEYEFALDKAGNICVVTEITEAEAAANKPVVALLISTGYKTIGGGTEIGSTATTYEFQAQVMYKDGTQELLKDVVLDEETDPDEWLALSNDDGLLPLIVTVTTTKDGSVIEPLEAAKPVTSDIKAAPAFADGLVANNSTLFFIVTTDAKGKVTYKASTGYKSLPALAKVTITVVDDDTLGKIVLIETDGTPAEATAETADYVYVLDADTYSLNADGYYVFDMVDIDGKAGELVVDENAFKSVKTGWAMVTSVDENKAALEIAEVGSFKEITIEGDGILTIDGETFLVDKATKCVMAYKNAQGANVVTAFSVDEMDGETYTYFGYAGTVKTNETADFLLVIRVTNPVEA